jgi:adenylosuccinate lyase
MVRSYAIPALENVALWHERDISHSSVERMIGPDATIALDFMLSRLTGLIDKLIIYPRNMVANLNKMGDLVYSESVLLALIRKGLTREAGYALVQASAMKRWKEGKDFRSELKRDLKKHLSEKEIDECLNLKHHLRHVDTIFKKAFS